MTHSHTSPLYPNPLTPFGLLPAQLPHCCMLSSAHLLSSSPSTTPYKKAAMLKLQPFRDTANKSNVAASATDEVSHITRKVASLSLNNRDDKENVLPRGKAFVSQASLCPASPATPKRKPLGLIDSPGPKPKDYVYYDVSITDVYEVVSFSIGLRF